MPSRSRRRLEKVRTVRGRRLACALASCGLAACDSSPQGSGGGSPPAAEPVLGNLTAGQTEETARLLARAQAALALLVPDAASAQYAEVRSGSGGAICGKVEIGATGILYPFVVLPGGNAMVSTGPDLRLEDPDDPFPDVYMQHCASVEELRRIGERMANGTAQVPAPTLAPPLPDPLPGGEPAEGLPEEASPPPAPPRRTPAPGSDDSFYNAIVRAPPKAAPHR